MKRSAMWLAAMAAVVGIVILSAVVNRGRAAGWNQGVSELHIAATAVAATGVIAFAYASVRARTVGRRIVMFVLADIAAAGTIVALTGNPTGPGAYAAIAAAALVAGVAAFWWLPLWQAARWPATVTDKERIELEDKARSTVAQLLGGLGLIATVALTLYQVNQGRIAADRTLELNVDQQVSERFSRAVDQLGARAGSRPMIEVRLGGVYSLEQYAERARAAASSEEASDTFDTVIAILAAYVRTNAPKRNTSFAGVRPLPAACGGRGYRYSRILRADTMTALDVVQRLREVTHLEGWNESLPPPDLSRVDLRGVDLSEALDFLPGVNLSGSTLVDSSLERTFLPDANLQSSDLAGAYLTEAYLNGADLRFSSLTGADFRRADLRGVNFEDANATNACFAGADLRKANFKDAVLAGAVTCGASGLAKSMTWTRRGC